MSSDEQVKPAISDEQIENATAHLDGVWKRLPDNDDRRAARHWLEQSEKAAHRSREQGNTPYEPEEIP